MLLRLIAIEFVFRCCVCSRLSCVSLLRLIAIEFVFRFELIAIEFVFRFELIATTGYVDIAIEFVRDWLR